MVFDHVGSRRLGPRRLRAVLRTVLSRAGGGRAQPRGVPSWSSGRKLGQSVPRAREHADDPRPARRVPRADPRGRGRLLAGGDRAGFRDDGPPRPRAIYGPDYYGGFLLDPDDNSVDGSAQRAVEPCTPRRHTDHLWICRRRPRGVQALLRDIGPIPGIRLGDDESGQRAVHSRGEDYSFSLVDDERPHTEHVHLAFPAGTTRRCDHRTPGRARRRLRGQRRRGERVVDGTIRATRCVRPGS